jgi:dipeptidyl aminopeptidase/acylaminoacyl peptidase
MLAVKNQEVPMKKSLISVIIVSSFFLFLSAEPGEKGKKIPGFDDVLKFQTPGSPVISPDGKWVLYTVSECDMEENEYRRQIWMVGIETQQPRQMTFSKKSSQSPQWSPNSLEFAFLAAREDKTQVYMMPAFGGEARPLTHSKTGVQSWQWSGDGKYIAFTESDEESKHDKAMEKKYGKFDVFNEKFDDSHLWILEIKTGKTEKIVDREDLYITGFAWSPDSRRLAFSALPDSRTESFSKSDIYVVNVKDKKIRELVTQEGEDDYPVWSEDGKWIAFNSQMGTEEYYVNTCIGMVPAAGGSIVNLTSNFDESVELIDWKGKRIWFCAHQGMSRRIFGLDPESKKIEPFTVGAHAKGRAGYRVSLSQQGAWLAYTYEDARRCPEVYASRTGKFSPLQLTRFEDQVAQWTLSTKEPIQWKSNDGVEITGVLIKPADFNPKKKYPLLVIIHGGPTSISIPTYFDSYGRYYPIEQWAARGAVLLEPNYRGSIGFGEEFRKLNYRNMGVGDYWDVISAVDYLISQGFIDENRVGAMGWSQGGYISAFIATYSQRFKAVSVGGGISDWVTYYVNTDIPPFTRFYLGTTPWDDEAVYKKTSPMTYINQANTPTLIQHGELDKRVPIPNAYKLYRGLKDKGVPVKFIIYKGFGHGINKPREKRAVLKHNFDWFNQYIWGEEPQEETLEEVNPDPPDKF